MSSYFTREGGSFLPTEHAIGPWSAEHLHGGPVAALLGRALRDRYPALQLARLTVDLWRPVPLCTLQLSLVLIRAGRQATRVEVTLRAEGETVAVATALLATREPVPKESEPLPHPPPDECATTTLPFEARGFQRSVELRQVSGSFGSGRACVWLRPEPTLVSDDPLHPVERALIVADTGNGVSGIHAWRTHTFANADLSIHLLREPRSEWIAIDATTRVDAAGVGLTHGRLFDTEGLVGHVLQGLLVRARGAAIP